MTLIKFSDLKKAGHLSVIILRRKKWEKVCRSGRDSVENLTRNEVKYFNFHGRQKYNKNVNKRLLNS